ncbi:hypothetical protein MKZ38_003925 [Zalerion maritima]|uniref:Uncharacterized protein n=1 Tax=Zalerion maritima TaxID=339359 RepID=A0AAD5RM70_9PEZI|nr:hypothetical protein MKZ38_003925 [Zalerion maritima]
MAYIICDRHIIYSQRRIRVTSESSQKTETTPRKDGRPATTALPPPPPPPLDAPLWNIALPHLLAAVGTALTHGTNTMMTDAGATNERMKSLAEGLVEHIFPGHEHPYSKSQSPSSSSPSSRGGGGGKVAQAATRLLYTPCAFPLQLPRRGKEIARHA